MLSTDSLIEELGSAPDPDMDSAALTQTRVDNVLRPAGATARLDELAVWLAGWQNRAAPTADDVALIVFAGDHGVAAEGVSAYPSEITAAMIHAFGNEMASINALASITGTRSWSVDVGVGAPTGNIRIESAMTPERFRSSFDAGRDAVASTTAELLVFGEFGIGNTTAAAALAAAFLGVPATAVTGRGTGIDDIGMSNKQRVVDDAVARIGGQNDPMEILRELGGTEIAAMAGAIFEARLRATPVLLDGFIVGAAALAVNAIGPGATAHCWAGHGSAEPGHGLVLDHLGLTPLLTLDLRLGEGSGAMVALPLVRAACALVNDVATFAELSATSPSGAE